MDFIDSGAETYLKITHSVQAAGGGYDREKLFFSRNELAGFISALRFLDGKLRAGEGVPAGLMVASLSGDITFGLSQGSDGPVLAITQRKELVDGKLRVNVVSLAVSEFPMLVSGVEEAMEAWR